MCRTTGEQRWRVIGELFNQLVNALIRAASHANVCSGALISASAECVSNDCKLDLVDNEDNLYAQQYVDEIVFPPKHQGKYLALYEQLYQCCRSSTSKCRSASLGCAQVFAGGVSGARSSPRNERSTAACHCHQCTRRAHSFLKDDITISAMFFHRS